MTTQPIDPTADALLAAIVQEALRLRYAWGHYRYLFVEDGDKVRVLNATAPDFFAWVQGLSADTVFLGIARLTDPATVSGRANASLAQLLEATGWKMTDTQKWEKYSTQFAEVLSACSGCRDYRHKRLGHFDLAVAMKVVPPPIVTVKELDAALNAVEQFLGAIHRELRPNSEQAFRFIDGDMHVRRLIERLTNRASQARPHAVSTIARRDDENGAQLECAFCGETSKVDLFSDDVPAARYLKAWHFDKCHGVIGTETVAVEFLDGSGQVRQTTVDLGSRD
jgi:AbiU2